MYYHSRILFLIPLFALPACQSFPAATGRDPLPLVRREVSITGGSGGDDARPQPRPGDSLSFGEAALLALRANPRLQSYGAARRSADGDILQASLRPNPTLDGVAENILGTGGKRSFSAAESTLAVSQLIERGGKLQARREVKEAEKALTLSSYDVTRREIFTEVGQAYAQALAAQEKVALYEELVQLNESFLPEIDKRIDAGKVTAVERVRAKTAVSTARLAKQQATREFHTASLRLAGTWGSTTAGFTRLEGTLGEPSAADRATLEQRLYDHPAFRKDDLSIWKAAAEHQLAITKGTPDVTVQGGLKHFSDDDEVALVVGFSIPLPFNDRNQGEIAAKQASVEVARRDRDATLTDLRVKLNSALKELTDTRAEIDTIKAELLPGAKEAFDAVEDGYTKGRLGYVDLIEARRSLTEARVQLLQATAAYQEAAAEVAGLTAPLPGQGAR
jgi:cobalt-zinc-cadmium efflux system outer membrane protein